MRKEEGYVVVRRKWKRDRTRGERHCSDGRRRRRSWGGGGGGQYDRAKSAKSHISLRTSFTFFRGRLGAAHAALLKGLELQDSQGGQDRNDFEYLYAGNMQVVLEGVEEGSRGGQSRRRSRRAGVSVGERAVMKRKLQIGWGRWGRRGRERERYEGQSAGYNE